MWVPRPVRSLLLRVKARISPRITTCEANWRAHDQEFELDFHKRNTLRQSERFTQETEIFFRAFGFQPDQFQGKVIVDVGAGSRLRTTFFRGAEIVAIEPLADRFQTEVPWCDLKLAKAVYPLPAEEYIADLEGRADFVFSMNALDHCFDFGRVASNLFRYLRRGATAFLSFDERLSPTEGHPLVFTEGVCSRIFRSAGFSVEKTLKGFPMPYREYVGRNGYSRSSEALSYWLRRR